MKKVVLFALLLATVAAASAHAVVLPRSGSYFCYHFQNGYFIGTGSSEINVAGSFTLQRGIERFKDPGMTFIDNRKVTFAWKSDNPSSGYSVWEFTINPGGPQCKKAYVYSNAIFYTECDTIAERDCYLLN